MSVILQGGPYHGHRIEAHDGAHVIYMVDVRRPEPSPDPPTPDAINVRHRYEKASDGLFRYRETIPGLPPEPERPQVSKHTGWGLRTGNIDNAIRAKSCPEIVAHDQFWIVFDRDSDARRYAAYNLIDGPPLPVIYERLGGELLTIREARPGTMPAEGAAGPAP